MYKRAVVICGGKGSRLMPYTSAIPKAMLRVGQHPVLEIIVRQLRYYGFTHITFSLHHLAESISNYFGNGSKWELQFSYSVEDFPLGTAGPLKLINDLPDNFLVINCDILADLDFDKFFAFHIKQGDDFTIAGYQKKYKIAYGLLQTDAAGRLIKIDEKPESLQINAGIYVAGKQILDLIPTNKPYGMDELMRDLVAGGSQVSVYPFEGYWQDVGNEEEYKKAMAELPTMGLTYLQNQE